MTAIEEALQKLVELTIETPEKIKILEAEIEPIQRENTKILERIQEIIEEKIELGTQISSINSSLNVLKNKFKKKFNFGIDIIKFICTIVLITLSISFITTIIINAPIFFLPIIIFLLIPVMGIIDMFPFSTSFYNDYLHKHNSEYKNLKDKVSTLEKTKNKLESEESSLEDRVAANDNIINGKIREIKKLLEELKQARTRYCIECFDNLAKTNPEMIPEDTVQEIETAFVKYKI